ncbi:hypothetical protein AURDEDRAFT_112915 [Auricularia subglabra TFB-10046 SS5]|nr:hypothetical protein AURDEDRAFT_112915 [Auricularia subglabra TFB-10046 SS5]
MTDATPAVLPTARDVLVDDTGPNITYRGAGWASDASDAAMYNRTSHWSVEQDAQFSFDYQGSDLWFYADIGPTHGAFGVLVDSVRYLDGSQRSPQVQGQVMLYHVPLQRGSHSLTVTNLNATRLSLDYLVYRPLSERSSLDSNDPRENVAASTVVAIVLGVICLALIIILGIAIALFRRQRRKRKASSTEDPIKPPPQGIDPFPIRYQPPLAAPRPPFSETTDTSTQPSQVDVTTHANAVAVDIAHAPAADSSRPEPDWLRANRLVLYQGPTG